MLSRLSNRAPVSNIVLKIASFTGCTQDYAQVQSLYRCLTYIMPALLLVNGDLNLEMVYLVGGQKSRCSLSSSCNGIAQPVNCRKWH